MLVLRGKPDFIRNDNGPEFASNAVKRGLKTSGVKTLFVAPGRRTDEIVWDLVLQWQ